jgi:hypothetical protein
MNAKWLIPFLIITAIAPIVFYFYNKDMIGTPINQQRPPVATIQFQKQNIIRKMEPGSQFGVISIQVIDGYKFKLQLDNGDWIEGHLTNATKDEALPFVIELYKTGSQPSVILYRKVEDYWIVDMQLNTQNGRESLVHLLQQQGLTY